MNYHEFETTLRHSNFRSDKDMRQAWRDFRAVQAQNGVISRGELEHILSKAQSHNTGVSQGTRRMSRGRR